jgi:hypothetical protein
VVGIHNRQIPQEARTRLEYYKTLIGCFVTVVDYEDKTSAGILKEITQDNHLLIQGNYKFSDIHIVDVRKFSARQDRNKIANGGGIRG